jgi:hypothetical protein
MAHNDKNSGPSGGGHIFTIVVNAKKVEVKDNHIEFEEVVKIAYPVPPPGTNIVYTVLYRNADEKKSDGSLAPGHKVKIKDGTVFNVSATDKS